MRLRDIFTRPAALTTPLDTLFGPGTSAAFEARMDISAQFPNVKATTLEWSNPNGSVGTETKWTTKAGALVGIYRLNYQSPVVHCVGLDVEPGFRGKGVLTQLCQALNVWWPTLGLTKNTMSPTPGDAERMLRLAGFDDLGDGTWGCHLPSTRLEEAITYLREKQEGKKPPQPPWRETLPLPTGEPF